MEGFGIIAALAISMLIGCWLGADYQTYSIKQNCKNYGATMLFGVKHACQKVEEQK